MTSAMPHRAPNQSHQRLSNADEPLEHLVIDLELNLDKDQLELIRKSWSFEFDWLADMGQELYRLVFTADAHLRSLFPGVAELPEDQWEHSKAFKKQGLRFMQVLSKAVQDLNRPDEMRATLYRLGRRHRAYMSTEQITSFSWDTFETSLLKLMSVEVNQDEASVQAWTILSNYLIHFLKQGFYGKNVNQ